MSLVLVHSGQTGVERGAVRVARAALVPIRGFCSREQTDELGPLPEPIRTQLEPWRTRGSRSALLASIGLANVVVVIVPRREEASTHVSVERICEAANRKRIAVSIIDVGVDIDDLDAFLLRVKGDRETFSVLVTGPRASRWSLGEAAGARVFAALCARFHEV